MQVNHDTARLVAQDQAPRYVTQNAKLDSSVLAINTAKSTLLDLIGGHPAALAYLIWRAEGLEGLTTRHRTRAATTFAKFEDKLKACWTRVDKLAAQAESAPFAAWQKHMQQQTELLKSMRCDRLLLHEVIEFVGLTESSKWKPETTKSIELALVLKSYHTHFKKISPAMLEAAQAGFSQVYDDAATLHLPLVKHVSSRFEMTHSALDGELLAAVATNGLLAGLDSFDTTHKFSCNSYIFARMRGAAIDEIRVLAKQGSGHGRNYGDNLNLMHKAFFSYMHKNSTAPNTDELLAVCSLLTDDPPSPAIITEFLNDVGDNIPLDAGTSLDEDVNHYGFVQDQQAQTPDLASEQADIAQLIEKHCQTLPDMQRKVLALYHFEDMRLKVIAEVFGFTESRACQILASAHLAIESKITKSLGATETQDLQKGGVGKTTKKSRPSATHPFAAQLTKHLAEHQVTNTRNGFDELNPPKAPGLIRGVDARRAEQFAQKLHKLSPVSLLVNDEFFARLSGNLIQCFQDAAYSEIALFISSAHRLLTGDDRRNGFQDGLVPQTLNLCWPLLAAVKSERAGINLALAFEVTMTVHAVHKAVAGHTFLPKDGMDFLETCTAHKNDSPVWPRIASRLNVVRDLALSCLHAKDGTENLRLEISRALARTAPDRVITRPTRTDGVDKEAQDVLRRLGLVQES